MSALTNEVCALIEQANDEERRVILAFLRERLHLHPLEKEWSTTAELILTAIARSADITLRGVRGILAEAIFEEYLLPDVAAKNWKIAKIIGEQAYDFLIERGNKQVKIQVKLQRRDKGEPKQYARKARKELKCPEGTMYLVEVQKTRGGDRNGEQTRPYRFGDFDVLAVNLHPATGDWKRFLFTVGDWLLPRKNEPHLIGTMQPVPLAPDDFWTDNLNHCIEWVLAGKKRRIYS